MNRSARRAHWREKNREHGTATTARARQESADVRNPGTVNVSIGTLVLEGCQRSDRYAIGEALQAEMRELIAANGLPAAFRAPAAIPKFPVPTISTGPRSKPAAVGAAVAGAIYRGGRS